MVGRVLSIEKHPDADKLIVCRVDVGTETVQIVTGAHNVSKVLWSLSSSTADVL